MLTGMIIRFGNFCHIPDCQLDRLVCFPDLWNSLSGCIKSGLPVVRIPTHRANRLTGFSKMNFTALVLHGLSTISVFKDVIAGTFDDCCIHWVRDERIAVGIERCGFQPGLCIRSSECPQQCWQRFFLFSFHAFDAARTHIGLAAPKSPAGSGPVHFWESYVKRIDSIESSNVRNEVS